MKAKKLVIAMTVTSGLSMQAGPAQSAASRVGPIKWTSTSFTSADLPCDLPEVPANFDLKQSRSADNAYLLMSASHLAYRFWPGRRERILRKWGFSHQQIFDDPQTSTNGFWAEHGEFVLTVFRGTQEPADLVTDVTVDLDLPPKDWQMPGRVHRGFLNAAISVEKHISIAAEYARKSHKPHIIAGHSLGGAIAALAALQLEKKNFQVHSVWSFGSPKIGNADFTLAAQRQLASKWQRLNQPNDPIPQLPFANSDREKLKSLAQDYGSWLPIIETLAENASYDPVSSVATSSASENFVTKRPLRDIARGFWKHLPRSYVCDLATRSLALH
jgi:hypothetical protein